MREIACGERRVLSAVLLAGGASRRFGADNKLIATVDGAPMLAKVAREILASGVTDVVAVTGATQADIAEALGELPVRRVHNGAWQEGLGRSIATGVAALSSASAGVFIVPGDLPRLTSAMFGRLAGAFWQAGAGRIVVPVTTGGQQRNPVLWPRRFFADLAALSGDRGGKSLLDTYRQERLDVAFDDPALFADIDTEADYTRLLAKDPR